MAISKPRATPVVELGLRAAPRPLLKDWQFIVAVGVVLLVLIWAPIIFAYRTAPPDRQFMGVLEGIPDHNQYFAWMRSLANEPLAGNRLTPEPSEPAFFNLLWWTAGRFGALTGLSYTTVYGLMRFTALFVLMAAVWFFVSLTLPKGWQRRLAFLLVLTGGGLGVIWVFVKYGAGLADVPFPGDVYTAEPNTLLILQVFPHFSFALTLITTIFGLMLLALRRQRLAYAVAAGVAGMALGLQHAYDLLTVYSVLGVFGLLVWARDRRFPALLFRCGLVLAALATPPALYLSYLVASDETWGRKLEQFDNAGVFTPGPLHLLILLGVPLVLALVAIRPRMFRSKDDGELFVATWFVLHFPLMYLPVKFQIHLLLGIQVPMMILATIAALRRRGQRWLYGGVVALLGLCLVTNLYLLAWRFVYLGRYEQPFYLSNDELGALAWLDQHAQVDDVVLAQIELGQFVPVWSDARAYIAHWAGTLDFFTKRDNSERVLDPATPQAERRALLDEFAVTYVMVREQDASRAAFAASAGPELVPVYENASVSIYRVSQAALGTATGP
jgi:hypothetical protein